ncbi:MAG: hypothetical protein ACFFBP_02970 [Promethearchaeota archaeon]
MNSKTKNRIVFRFQVIFFIILIFLTVVYGFSWLLNFLDPLNVLSNFIPKTNPIPPIEMIIFTIFSITLMFLNWALASFSLYAFVFILRILESNPEKTTPICAMTLDVMIITQFLFHLSVHGQIRYSENLFPSMYYIIPNFFTQYSEIFLVSATFLIIMGLKFGIEGINKRRYIRPNFLSDFIHILMVLNAVLVIVLFIFLINVLRIDFIKFILSISVAIVIFSLLILIMKKKNIKFPINAIAKYDKKK